MANEKVLMTMDEGTALGLRDGDNGYPVPCKHLALTSERRDGHAMGNYICLSAVSSSHHRRVDNIPSPRYGK